MAETKPYDLQSPEQIAKDYGGNKQKIAEAMQLGVLDPTAGTLAAMFIDRMRNAAQAEATPQQTVAQQVFAPPTPPQMPAGIAALQGAPAAPTGAAGLAAMPEAAAMMPPEAVQMGVPGMAMGGLTTLPVPDGMFDEPGNGGYANGGLVAFATGDEVKDEGEDDEEINVIGKKPKEDEEPKITMLPSIDFVSPESMGGFKNDLYGNLDIFSDAAPRETAEAKGYMDYLKSLSSPEEQKKRRQEDMWMALGQIGAKMASTPGSLLQAAGAGIGAALPGVASAAKDRRAAQQAAMQARVVEERTGNKELETRANVALDMLKGYNSIAEAFKDNQFKTMLTKMGIDADLAKAKILAGAGIREAIISAATSRYVGGIGYSKQRGLLADTIGENFDKAAANDQAYQDLMEKDPLGAQRYRDNYITDTLDRIMPMNTGAVDLGNY